MAYNITIAAVTTCGVWVLFVSIYKILAIARRKDNSDRYLNTIWQTGILAFILGILGQFAYMSDMLDAIESAEELYGTAIAEGIDKARFQPLGGFGVLIMSLTFWRVIKTWLVWNRRKS